jgi:DegV family protein with EDD domain
MSNVCILTDSTVQFTHPNFPGHKRVHIIPFELQSGVQPGSESRLWSGQAQRLIPPSQEEFIRFYMQLSHEYDTILVLTLSALLSPATSQAISASVQYCNHATVEVIDSQTIGLGLGFLVQAAAAVASTGAPLADIERQIRASIPRIYMLFCIPELTYLAHSGFMEYSQALVGEMMGMLPIFVIEEGRLTPMEKVRTQRHLFEAFQEFMNEFDAPAHIALVRGANHNTIRSRPVHQYIREAFPETPYSEHAISPNLAALFGPQSIGLVIMEKLDQRCS